MIQHCLKRQNYSLEESWKSPENLSDLKKKSQQTDWRFKSLQAKWLKDAFETRWGGWNIPSYKGIQG